MDNLLPPGRGTFGGGSLGHLGNGQHATANHREMGSQCRRCSVDRCIVPAGAGGHASRLLPAQPELDPLQPASLPMLETLRAGFWRCGGTLSCWLRGVNRGGFTFIRAPERYSLPPPVNSSPRRWRTPCAPSKPQTRSTRTSTSRLQSMPDTSHVVRTTRVRKRGEYHY